MSDVDLEAVARTAVRAIVAKIGPGQVVSTPRGSSPGLKARRVMFLPGKEEDAAATLARTVEAQGIRRFAIRSSQEAPGLSQAVVTEDGVSVRACSFTDVSGQTYHQIEVLGVGPA